MENREYTVYNFDELPDESKEMAIQRYADINVDYSWWDYTYDDAQNIGLEVLDFDDKFCDMKYIEEPMWVIYKVLRDHGENCETYKTVCRALFNRHQMKKARLWNSDEYDTWANELLHSLSEDYRIMLRNEYEYLTSEDCISEILRCNEYDFTLSGEID